MTFGFGGTIGLDVSGLFGGTAFHFSDPFFHLFARFERDHELLGDEDFITRSRVAGLASSPSFDLKNAKISEFDAVVFHQSLNNGIESLLDDFLGFELRQPNLLGDGLYDLFLGHD
jgi:hypothetical protein